MTETTVEGTTLREAPQIVSRLPVLVKVGLADERTVEIELGSSVTGLLDIIAAERGCRIEELTSSGDPPALPGRQ